MKVTLKKDLMKTRFEEVYGRFKNKELNCEEASDILGICGGTTESGLYKVR